MKTMSQAFSGNIELQGVDDFLNTSGFEFPDLQAISQGIYDGITNYMIRNLGEDGMKLGEEAVQNAVAAMQEELSNERGPDFYKLPALFQSVGLNKE
jgi:hypothetical protein